MARHELPRYALIAALTWAGVAHGVPVWILGLMAVVGSLLAEYFFPSRRTRSRFVRPLGKTASVESRYEVRVDDETLGVTHDGVPRGFPSPGGSSRTRTVDPSARSAHPNPRGGDPR
jgi:hypothetical protein